MEALKELVQHKWITIWLLTAIVKWIVQLRKQNFNVLVFITDTVLALIVWYVSWELVAQEDMLWVIKLIFTIFMSWNAFVLVSILFNPELAKKVFFNFIKQVVKADLTINDKKDEK